MSDGVLANLEHSEDLRADLAKNQAEVGGWEKGF